MDRKHPCLCRPGAARAQSAHAAAEARAAAAAPRRSRAGISSAGCRELQRPCGDHPYSARAPRAASAAASPPCSSLLGPSAGPPPSKRRRCETTSALRPMYTCTIASRIRFSISSSCRPMLSTCSRGVAAGSSRSPCARPRGAGRLGGRGQRAARSLAIEATRRRCARAAAARAARARLPRDAPGQFQLAGVRGRYAQHDRRGELVAAGLARTACRDLEDVHGVPAPLACARAPERRRVLAEAHARGEIGRPSVEVPKIRRRDAAVVVLLAVHVEGGVGELLELPHARGGQRARLAVRERRDELVCPRGPGRAARQEGRGDGLERTGGAPGERARVGICGAGGARSAPWHTAPRERAARRLVGTLGRARRT